MRVLVTGGSGFLGNALTDALLQQPQVERVRIVSRDEHKKGAMTAKYGQHHAFQALLADVREPERLMQVMGGIDTVIHAAALKRVDNDADEAIEMCKTNVTGTLNVLEAATACGVRRVIVVSSDKAVAPENAYGKSKALAEEIAVAYNSISYPRGTRVSVVRYGNVLWSTGSVLCKWRDAKTVGKPILITDKRMTRFVLTVKQAVEFVLHALGAMTGGEIFIPRLPSCRIMDLALAFDTESDIDWIGRRPGGEKLAERLIGPEEMTRTVEQAGAYVILPSRRGWSTIPYHGNEVKPDWNYSSDVNAWWVSSDELRTMIKEQP